MTRMEDGIDELAERGTQWRAHCAAAAEHFERLAADHAALGPQAYIGGPDLSYLAQRWRGLQASDLAGALFAMDLTEGERILTLSLGHPLNVENMLAPTQVGDQAKRQCVRVEQLGERLRSVILFGSSGALSLFPSDPPFGGREPSAAAAKMRPRRLAHLGSVFGSAGVMVASALVPALHAASAAVPFFSILAATAGGAMALSTSLSLFERTPESFPAASIVKMAWPALSSKMARKMFGNGGFGDEAEDELRLGARVAAPGEAAALASIGGEDCPLDAAPAQWSPEARAWAAPYMAAKERQDMRSAIGAALSPAGKARSL